MQPKPPPCILNGPIHLSQTLTGGTATSILRNSNHSSIERYLTPTHAGHQTLMWWGPETDILVSETASVSRY